MKVWENREYKNLDDSVELGVRNIKVALRRLRKFARTGAPDELDLDGTIAKSAHEGYLDIVLDFIVYSGLPFAFALGHPEHALAAAFLIFSFVGTGTSFLAFAIFKRDAPTLGKAFHYLGGLTEGAETIAFFVLVLLFPGAFGVAAVIFGVLCWLTTAGRIAAAVGALR